MPNSPREVKRSCSETSGRARNKQTSKQTKPNKTKLNRTSPTNQNKPKPNNPPKPKQTKTTFPKQTNKQKNKIKQTKAKQTPQNQSKPKPNKPPNQAHAKPRSRAGSAAPRPGGPAGTRGSRGEAGEPRGRPRAVVSAPVLPPPGAAPPALPSRGRGETGADALGGGGSSCEGARRPPGPGCGLPAPVPGSLPRLRPLGSGLSAPGRAALRSAAAQAGSGGRAAGGAGGAARGGGGCPGHGRGCQRSAVPAAAPHSWIAGEGRCW